MSVGCLQLLRAVVLRRTWVLFWAGRPISFLRPPDGLCWQRRPTRQSQAGVGRQPAIILGDAVLEGWTEVAAKTEKVSFSGCWALGLARQGKELM